MLVKCYSNSISFRLDGEHPPPSLCVARGGGGEVSVESTWSSVRLQGEAA